VTTAKAENGFWPTDPIVSCDLGVNAWKKTWSNLHMVLGHYYLSEASCMPALGDDGDPAEPDDFASMLKAGDTVKDAYFDIHGFTGTFCNNLSNPAFSQPSAIAISPTSCCIPKAGGGLYCPQGGCEGDYMNSETWTSLMADLATRWYFTTAWRVAE
jgi:hypothetical protein